jgi:hypothetical protein
LPLGLLFVDLKKAYDSIDRQKLWDVLMLELKIPENIVNVIQNLYLDTIAHVQGLDTPGCTFSMNKGVK